MQLNWPPEKRRPSCARRYLECGILAHGFARDHRNLYLVGSATFPTITASPPTLTIAAFAMRAGPQMRTDLQGV